MNHTKKVEASGPILLIAIGIHALSITRFRWEWAYAIAMVFMLARSLWDAVVMLLITWLALVLAMYATLAAKRRKK
jgi:hypothetical protein